MHDFGKGSAPHNTGQPAKTHQRPLGGVFGHGATYFVMFGGALRSMGDYGFRQTE
jgi:hypothetical protein